MAQEELKQLIYTNKARYLRPLKGITLPGLFLLLLFAVFLIPSISLAAKPDPDPPLVSSTVPTNDATGVTLNSNVTISLKYSIQP